MIPVKCPKDGTLHYADESQIGKTLRCRTCGANLKIGSQDQSPSGDNEPDQKINEAGTPQLRARAPKKGHSAPVKRAPWVYVLAGVVLGVFVAFLFSALKLGNQSSVLNQIQSSTATQSSQATPSGDSSDQAPETRESVSKRAQRRGPEGDSDGMLLPCAQGHQPTHPANGERILPDGEKSGQSNIRVTNASDLDAVVKLVDSNTGKASRFVYIQAGNTFGLEGIPAGAYSLRFQFGKDWIPECHEFVRDSLSGEFTHSYVFMDDRIRFYTITLGTALGGTSNTRRIDQKQFVGAD